MKIGRNEIALALFGCLAFLFWLVNGTGAQLFLSGFAFGACLIMGMADKVISDAVEILNNLRDEITRMN